MDWQELIDRACMTIPAEKEEKMFEEAVEKEEISEAVLIMNPKHKGQLDEFLNASGLTIPIIWHRYVEEDQAYMVTDKELARNIREAYDLLDLNRTLGIMQ